MAYCHCIYAEVSLVYYFSVSGVMRMILDSEFRLIGVLVNSGKLTVDQAREIGKADSIEILYAYDEPCIILIRNAGEPTKEIGLYSEDYETQKRELIKVNPTLQDVVERCVYGEISYKDAQLWCLANDISFHKFDRWLYYALRNPGKDIPAEPESWWCRLVSFLKRSLDWLLNSILEVFT